MIIRMEFNSKDPNNVLMKYVLRYVRDFFLFCQHHFNFVILLFYFSQINTILPLIFADLTLF
jgi:hypothetical protein